MKRPMSTEDRVEQLKLKYEQAFKEYDEARNDLILEKVPKEPDDISKLIKYFEILTGVIGEYRKERNGGDTIFFKTKEKIDLNKIYIDGATDIQDTYYIECIYHRRHGYFLEMYEKESI